MSELKYYPACITTPKGKFSFPNVYLKDEADKVIEELKDKALQYKVLYKEECRDIKTQERFFAKYRAHDKYKRCLAMADMNWWQANRYSAAEMVERIRWNLEEATKCSKLNEKYLKRYHKWLALA